MYLCTCATHSTIIIREKEAISFRVGGHRRRGGKRTWEVLEQGKERGK